MKRKGLEMPLVLVITAVVLIVISLIIISITSGGLTNFFKTATDTQTSAGDQLSDVRSKYTDEIGNIAGGDGGTTGGNERDEFGVCGAFHCDVCTEVNGLANLAVQCCTSTEINNCKNQ